MQARIQTLLPSARKTKVIRTASSSVCELGSFLRRNQKQSGRTEPERLFAQGAEPLQVTEAGRLEQLDHLAIAV